MIIKAESRSKPKKGLGSNQSKIKIPVPKDRRFLICIDSVDESIFAYVYDLRENRIVYKATSSILKNIENIYQEIYKCYKKSETRIVEPDSIRDVIEELPANNKKLNLLQHITKLKEEATPTQPTRLESIHIRRVKDIYKYVDKYQVKLNIEIVKHPKRNGCLVYLYDEEQGIGKSVHVIECDYDRSRYRYLYMGKQLIASSDLEDIFK